MSKEKSIEKKQEKQKANSTSGTTPNATATTTANTNNIMHTSSDSSSSNTVTSATPTTTTTINAVAIATATDEKTTFTTTIQSTMTYDDNNTTPATTTTTTTTNMQKTISVNGSGTVDVDLAAAAATEEYILHKLVFEGDFKQLAKVLQQALRYPYIQKQIARKDKHGNSPLHLAVMLGRKECIHLLLAHGSPVKVKNNDGWSPLAEAISYGDRQTISAVLRKLKQQSRQQMESRRANLVRALRQMQDFYMELKWDFVSWLPLVSRMLPSDICRIHKAGASLRLDTTLVDFNDMRWERGNISFLFRGDRPAHESLIVLDNEYECYQHVRYEDADIEEDEVDVLMSTDILAAQMSTKSIHFTRAQSGWIFREDRKELVSGQYQCDLYAIQGLVLKQRKRREHLSHEDLQKNRAMVDSITKGGGASARRGSFSASNNGSHSNGSSSDTIVEPIRRSSLQPPPPPTLTWQQYINAPVGMLPPLGRTPVLKQSNKTLRATVAMSKDFPLSVDMLLNVLEVIAPFKHISKLRDFVALKLPAGFPVKVEIPVLHTVTAKITFQKFEFRDNIPAEMFEVPDHYMEDARHFPDL